MVSMGYAEWLRALSGWLRALNGWRIRDKLLEVSVPPVG